MYEITQYQDGTVVTADGEGIFRESGDGYHSEKIQEAILTDANFGSPQKEALKALLGILDVDYRPDETMPP